MITIINEELFSFGVTTLNDPAKGIHFKKLHFLCSEKLRVAKFATNGEVVSEGVSTTPIKREILRLSVPADNFEEQEVCTGMTVSNMMSLSLPMNITIQYNNFNKPIIEMRAHPQGDDKNKIFIIAIPFNGLFVPIPHDEKYRIYKGSIVTSCKPFFFNKRRYKKVLYLVCEVNRNLFDPSHKYHTNEINIAVESYAIYDDASGSKFTNREKFTLRVTDSENSYTTQWEYESFPHVVRVETNNEPLWHTFKYEDKHKSTTQSKEKSPYKKYDITEEKGRIERVGVNKYGIPIEKTVGGNTTHYSKDEFDYKDNRHHKGNNKKKGKKRR